MNKNIKVLHVDSEKSWRGGQQQAAYLFERMYKAGYETALVCIPGSEFHKYCEDNELPYYAVKMSGELDIIAGYKIAKICKEKGYNILHLHSAHAMATGIWAKLFNKKLKLIGARRVDFNIRKNPFSYYKYSSPKMNRIVCISGGIKKVMIQDGISDSKLVTIHSGVNLDRFRDDNPGDNFKKVNGIPDEHIVIGTVAAISGHKDYPNLLHAAKKVINETENVTFCAVGSGPDEEEVHALHKKLNLGDRFIFTGFRKDVGNFLKIFDIFVLSSYQEGLGTSILDAQGVGLPVVACETGGIPEIVYNDVNGLLVPVRDHDRLAESLLNLVMDENKRYEYGRKALETVKKYSIENTVKKNISLYEELLNE